MGRRKGLKPDHWFEPVADHLGEAYLRYSFTKGTDQEVAFLTDVLELRGGQRLLDIGCGPGRHALALAARGIEVVGIDISQRFIDIATKRTPAGATASFRRLDARALPFDHEFDAAVSLCQGAFGLVGPGPDLDVLGGIERALVPGGRFAISAFSSYFQVKYPQEQGTFEVATGVHHERTVVKDEAGAEAEVDLWTTCYTPRELGLLVERAGLVVDHIWSVDPGHYDRSEPTIETSELLVVGRTARYTPARPQLH
ncbi:MAG TPA: methyltransferase domain-containing protein [Acidimicrobiales bacterium]|jgi:SAM-dependent methyltransferase|nr:methyltransferase domain-containing protein [Acidimicrobiales bacterium]